jgi:hypothetical protein
MSGAPSFLQFEQFHIDVARNSTDDFNPFHDPFRWQNVRGNPFGSTIVLGFQLAFLAAERVRLFRRHDDGETAAAQAATGFGNYDFVFADALRPGEAFALEIRKTLDKRDQGGGISNRVVVRKRGGGLVLMGTLSDTAEPRFENGATLGDIPLLDALPDRVPIPGTPYFHKQKFLNTSNGKNFCLASLVEQQGYFDELIERVCFPELFTAALLSSALLEKARGEGYDFEGDPVVYTRHQISVDHALQVTLRSNDRLHLLVEGPLAAGAGKGLGKTTATQYAYRCLGAVRGRLLLRARVEMAPLAEVGKPVPKG